MTIVTSAHRRLVFARRVRRLVTHLADAVPQGAALADVGAGDGLVARRLLSARPDLSVLGFDVLIRPVTHIEVTRFDGWKIPLPDGAVDYTMFVDVLHHTAEPEAILTEGCRIARRGLLIKDHLAESGLDAATLRVMDWVGNAGHGVRLEYHYWSRDRWRTTFTRLGLEPVSWNERLRLYPFPASLVFDRSLHFLARLERRPPVH